MADLPAPDWRPARAFVPGQGAHPEQAQLSAIRATVAGVAPDLLAETPAWSFGLAFLRDGFFWEAHEVLEAVWLALPPNSAERVLCQGLIQLANAGLKRLMRRDGAAARLQQIADARIGEGIARGGLAGLRLQRNELAIFKDAVGC